MKFSISVNGQNHTLELLRRNGFSWLLDGAPLEAEIAEVRPGVYSFLLGGRSFCIRVSPGHAGSSARNGDYSVQIDGLHYAVSLQDPRRRKRGGAGQVLEGKRNIIAPMPGKVVRVLVSENESIAPGQGLVVVEAMKMQNEIKCPAAGTVQKVLVREGQPVNSGEILVVVE